MTMQWWYVKDGQRLGPVEESELKVMAESGSLGPDDLVWNSSMGQTWKKASEVPGVFEIKSEPQSDAAEGGESADSAKADNPKAELSYPAVYEKISLTNPVDSAWTGTRKILFKPFDISKWFALGFSAWLAALLEGGGANFNYNSGGGDGASGGFQEIVTGVRDAWSAWQGVIIASATALVLLGIVVGIALIWVRSRGKFMFLDNLVKNTSEIKKPWREFSQHGDSLFKWTLVYSIIMFAVFLVLMGGTFLAVIMPCIRAETFLTSTIPAIVILGILWIAFAIVGGYITRFLEDFIVPIMYKNDMTAVEAWSYFVKVYRSNTGRLLLYGLFYLVLGIGAGAVVMIATLITCCILGCIAMIPYVGTVALLPVPVFFRLYSIYYIAQFGKDFDLVTGAEFNAE